MNLRLQFQKKITIDRQTSINIALVIAGGLAHQYFDELKISIKG